MTRKRQSEALRWVFLLSSITIAQAMMRPLSSHSAITSPILSPLFGIPFKTIRTRHPPDIPASRRTANPALVCSCAESKNMGGGIYSTNGMSATMTPHYAAVSMASQIILASTRRLQKARLPHNENSAIDSSTENNRATTRNLSGNIFMMSMKTMIKQLRGGGGVAVPPTGWLLPAWACAASYALYNLFIKKAASSSMDPILGGVLLQFVAALLGSLLWMSQRIWFGNAAATITKSGVIWSVAAGIAVGMAELLSFVVSGKGVPATQSIPIIVGGSILVGTLLGAVWLQERVSRTGWMGVLLIAAGIALVGMDGIGGH